MTSALASSFHWMDEELQFIQNEGLFRKLKTLEPTGPVSALLNGRTVTLFSSNDYLGLSGHPKLIEAAEKALHQYGTGAKSARLISGGTKAHETLEEKIAHFEGKERALVFSSGYLANLGVISTLAQKGDLLILDKLSHASIVDASRLSEATVRVFPHKNLEYLEKILKSAASFKRIWIATDSVFSMDGDLAPLRELVALKRRFGAYLIIDEAHGTGVFGKSGRGVSEHFGVSEEIDVHLGTLSKAAGGLGGFAAGKRELIEYLINKARSFIFATALPPAVCAAAAAAFNVMENEPSLREKLWQNVAFLNEGFTQNGLPVLNTVSPIIPILAGGEKEALSLSGALLEAGFFVPAVRYPTVPKNKARLRLSVSAAHSKNELEQLLRAFQGKI